MHSSFLSLPSYTHKCSASILIVVVVPLVASSVNWSIHVSNKLFLFSSFKCSCTSGSVLHVWQWRWWVCGHCGLHFTQGLIHHFPLPQMHLRFFTIRATKYLWFCKMAAFRSNSAQRQLTTKQMVQRMDSSQRLNWPMALVRVEHTLYMLFCFCLIIFTANYHLPFLFLTHCLFLSQHHANL